MWLVQKGTPAPELTGNLAGAHIVPIPVERVYENSRGASLVTALEYLGEAESLIGLGYLPSGDVSETTPELAKRYQSDDFLVTGAADAWEPVVAAEPDMVVVPFNARQRETALSLGLPAVFYNSFWETPLGSAEHLKYWALFFNKEEKANELFAPVEEAYVVLAGRVASAVPASERTAVLHGQLLNNGSWFTYGPDRVDYHLIRDAGGTPMLLDEDIALDAFAQIAMELVLEVVSDADFWWNPTHISLVSGLDMSDGDEWVSDKPLYGELDPLLNGNAFHHFKPGNDDYFKTALNYRADLVLRDMVSILHPGVVGRAARNGLAGAHNSSLRVRGIRAMPYAASEGARIHFHVEGTGPPLVLLHGFGVSGEAWHTGGHVDALSNQFQVITMDARGHGRSGKPHGLAAYSIPNRVRDVTSVLDAVGVETAHFLGYSLGGVTGFGLSKHAPERFRSVIVLGAHPYPETSGEFEVWGRRYMERGVDAAIERREAESGPLSDEQRAELEKRDWKALGAALISTGRAKGLGEGLLRGRIPYLLLCGTEDDSHELVLQAARDFPNVSSVSLKGLDHHESRSRLDVLIPIVREFFGSSRGVTDDRAK